MHTVYKPLSSLGISPRNARYNDTSSVDELAALIKSQGLLQNLLVADDGVIAGGRRLRAMNLLVSRGDWQADAQVPCFEIPDAQAEAASIAENSGRVPMHPADEFEAFKRMHSAGTPVEDIAAGFGLSPIVVQRRLKLANVSPMLIDLYRQGEMQLDQITALAITDDHGLQERTWAKALPHQRYAGALRASLTPGTLHTRHNAAARYVGISEYEAAGGEVVRDLFAGPEDGYLKDNGLLTKLLDEKLEVEAARLREAGWSWVSVIPTISHNDVHNYDHSKPTRQQPTAEVQQQLDTIDAAIKALDTKLDAPGNDEDSEEIGLEIEALNEKRQTILDDLVTFSERQMKKAGAIVGLDHAGELQIHLGLIKRAEPAKTAVAAKNGTQNKPNPKHSEALIRRLSAHRTVAMAAQLLEAPRAALDLLCATVATQVLYSGPAYGHHLQIRPEEQLSGLLNVADDIEGSKAWKAITARRQQLREMMPAKPAGLFKWLGEQSTADVLDILCFCVASCTNAVTGREGPPPLADLQAVIGLDMADWWQPTATGYLKHVRKDVAIAAVVEAGGKAAAPQLEKLKKGQIDVQAEQLLADTGWLPSVLRGPAIAKKTAAPAKKPVAAVKKSAKAGKPPGQASDPKPPPAKKSAKKAASKTVPGTPAKKVTKILPTDAWPFPKN